MEKAVYDVLLELDAIITNPKGLLTTTDIAYLHATIHTLLAVYDPTGQPPLTNPNNPVDSIGEARRPPANRPKESKWMRAVRGIFG